MDLRDRLSAALAGRYEIEEELGRGGMAVVYLARDLKLGRRVAIKVLRPEFTASLIADRFLQEIQFAAQLEHPGIVPLFESDSSDGLLWYAMPHIKGETLHQRLARETQLPVDEAVRITCEVAQALTYAHGQGVIHRDIKPANILFADGHPLIADFGIAKAFTEAGGPTYTATAVGIGTPGYMSPEQATGEKNIDVRTDVYSLGCVLYEMLAGEPPYTGPTAQAIIAKQLSLPVPSVCTVRETVPPALDGVLRRALARVPADRFATVAEFATMAEGAATIRHWSHRLLPALRLLNGDASGVRARRAVLAASVVAVAGLALIRLVPSAGIQRAAVKRPPLEAIASVRVGVLPTEVGEGSAEQVSRARLVQHLFASELIRRRGLAVVDPISLNSRLEAARSEPGTDPMRVLRDWGVRYLVRSTVTTTPGALDVTYFLTDARQGHVVETGAFTNIDEATLSGQVRQAVGLLLDALEMATGGIAKGLDMEPFLARAPSNADAVSAFLQGIDYSFRGLRGGRTHFERALELDHSFVAPRVWLVSGLVRAGDTAAARPHVEVLQSLRTEATPFEHALIGWAEAVVKGDWEAKVHHLRVALGYSPRNNALLYNLGYSLMAMGRPEEAVAPIREALESGWRFAPLYTLWGVVAVQAGELTGLRETLGGARGITPPNPYLSGLLEALALYEGDTVGARRDGVVFRAAVADGRATGGFSEMVPVFRSLGQRARERRDFKTAALLLERAVDAGPDQPIPRLELALVLADAGDAQAAEIHYRAVSREERTPAVTYLLGEVAARLGRDSEAATHFEQYLLVAPDGPDAVRARERLRSLKGASGPS